ncbi:MAG: hypothetical protein ACKVOX_05685 [Rhizobacter sp.]
MNTEPELLPTLPRSPEFIDQRKEKQRVRAQIDAVIARRDHELMCRRARANDLDSDPLDLYR